MRQTPHAQDPAEWMLPSVTGGTPSEEELLCLSYCGWLGPFPEPQQRKEELPLLSWQCY